MKIEKKKIDNYEISIYKTDRYSSINIELLFQVPFTRENLLGLDLLNEYMVHTTKKYPRRKDIDEKLMDLYSMGIGISNHYMGEILMVECFFGIADPKLVHDDYFEKAIKFAHGVIFEPNFKDGHLDRNELKRCKDKLIDYVGNEFLDPHAKRRRSFYETVFPNTRLTREYTSSKEEYAKILDSFTDEFLIDLYAKTYLKSFVTMIAMGNLKKKELDIIGKYFKFDTVKKLDTNYIVPVKMKKSPKYVTVADAETKESSLTCVYTAPTKTLKERVTYAAIDGMLSSTGMLLHKVLRDERKLVYNTSCQYTRRLGYIYIGAYIDKKDEKSALEGIEETLNLLKDPKIVKKELKKIKEHDKMLNFTYEENKWNPYNDLANEAFEKDFSKKERRDARKTLTVDDIIEAVSNMKLVKIHFYRGDKK